MKRKRKENLKKEPCVWRKSFKDPKPSFFFYSSTKTETVLFVLVGKYKFFHRANFMNFFFIKWSFSKQKGSWHVSFVVHSHLKISKILHILIKLENNYVLDEKMNKNMKINNEKGQIWIPSARNYFFWGRGFLCR